MIATRFKRALLYIMLAVSIASIVPVTTFAWGPKGHKIVALIAKKHLSSKAKAGIKKLLPKGTGIDSIASWADVIRPFKPETGGWHFVDIPITSTDYDPARDCKQDDCIVEAIDQFKNTLSDVTAEKKDRTDALKFLVHFLGDLHQPLHCSDDNDRGGNNVIVKFFNRKTSLHKIWDSGIIERAGLTEKKYAKKLNDALTQNDIDNYQSGSIIDWTLESHQAAIDVAYKNVHAGDNLAQTYFDAAKPVVDLQLAKAGARLAAILNEAFGE